MPFLNDYVLDAALAKINTEGEVLHICSAEPSTYTEAITTYSLGNKSSPTIGAAADRTGGGREVVVSAITDGSATDTGTATHWAIVDVSNTRLLAAKSLTEGVSVTSGGTFTLGAFPVGIQDAT